jgi:hypothetical protein
VNKLLQQFQMTNSHPKLLPIDPTTRLMIKDSVLEADEYHLLLDFRAYFLTFVFHGRYLFFIS